MVKINYSYFLDAKWLILLGILLSSICLALSPLLLQHPKLATGITLDLTISIPIVYLWIIRNKGTSNFSVVPVFIACLLFAYFLLPATHHQTVHWVKGWILPLIEMVVLSLILFKIRQSWIFYKREKTKRLDFLTILRESTNQAFGKSKFAKVLSTELAVFYYVFYWGKIPKADTAHSFSYHRKSGQAEVLGAVLFILIIETIPTHILLSLWNETIAWIASISSLYLVMQVVGHLRASRIRLIQLNANQLLLHHGLTGDTEINYSNIEKIELNKRTPKKEKFTLKLGLLPELESHNIIIYLKQPQILDGLYGVQKEYKKLLFFVDNREDFLKQISTKIDFNG